jgi:hypothetical protein
MAKTPDARTVRSYIALPADLWRDIEAYRDRERIVTTAEAVRRLLVDALKAEKRKAAKQ